MTLHHKPKSESQKLSDTTTIAADWHFNADNNALNESNFYEFTFGWK